MLLALSRNIATLSWTDARRVVTGFGASVAAGEGEAAGAGEEVEGAGEDVEGAGEEVEGAGEDTV